MSDFILLIGAVGRILLISMPPSPPLFLRHFLVASNHIQVEGGGMDSGYKYHYIHPNQFFCLSSVAIGMVPGTFWTRYGRFTHPPAHVSKGGSSSSEN